MSGDNLTILVAVAAGLISFLSPCVLPLVPAYLGQLTAVAVAGAAVRPDGTVVAPSRWTAFRHALAYVAGFGAIFTLLGVTATFMASGFSAWMPVLRQVGGFLLILLGLNLAGILRIPALDRTWRPLDAGASASLATATGTMSFAPAGGPGSAAGSGARPVTGRGGWRAGPGLGPTSPTGRPPAAGGAPG